MHTTGYYVDDPQERQRLQYGRDVFSSIHYMSSQFEAVSQIICTTDTHSQAERFDKFCNTSLSDE